MDKKSLDNEKFLVLISTHVVSGFIFFILMLLSLSRNSNFLNTAMIISASFFIAIGTYVFEMKGKYTILGLIFKKTKDRDQFYFGIKFMRIVSAFLAILAVYKIISYLLI